MPDVMLEERTSGETPVPARPVRWRKWIVSGLVALAVVAVTIAVLARDGGARDAADGGQGGYAPEVSITGVGDGAATQFEVGATVAGPLATSAVDAVRRYLDAEIAGDTTASYGQLSAEDRAQIGSAQDWDVLHDAFPVYLSYAVVGEDGTDVVVDAQLVAAVDEVVGVVPGAARVTFATAQEDGGFRIVLADASMEPQYPARELAPARAEAWIAALQSCATDDAAQFAYGGSLLGDLGVAEGLCAATGDAMAGTARGLDALRDPAVVLTAFGDGAATWAAVVEVTGLDGIAPLDVVLAPLGDQWVVVAVMGAA